MTAVKSSDYKSSTDNLISKERIAKGVVGKNGSLFTWRKREVFTNLSVRIVGLRVEIWTRELQNSKKEMLPSNRDVS